jgi:hypothetical protein
MTTQQTLGLRGGTYAVYSGKCVPMDYIENQRERFKRAAQRVADNAGEGYVIEDTGAVYRIELPSRRASLVIDIFEAERVRKLVAKWEAQK